MKYQNTVKIHYLSSKTEKTKNVTKLQIIWYYYQTRHWDKMLSKAKSYLTNPFAPSCGQTNPSVMTSPNELLLWVQINAYLKYGRTGYMEEISRARSLFCLFVFICLKSLRMKNRQKKGKIEWVWWFGF